jgi:superfamily II DNA/RNA helicase
MSSPSTPVDVHASTFESLGLSSDLVKVLKHKGITEPLPIQVATIADALEGRDVSGKAPTGSGKTLAFSLPMAARISKGRSRRPAGLVLAPTRELAAQIATVLAPLVASRGLSVHAFYGGVGYGPQIKALHRGVDIVVACPGRLEDLMGSGHVILDCVEMVVIDEADRMADMGFLPAVRRILDTTRADRQTLLFSATLDGDVDVLVRRYQNDPVRHEVTVDEDEVSRMTHKFQYVAHDDRVASCAKVVADNGSTMLFVRTRHGADRLAKQLSRSGIEAAAIHGDRSQAQRERALRAFGSGSVRALVATDVAARGIHVDDVSCVIHFDLPADPKDYVHRSGRTARAGAEGIVISMVTPEHKAAADKLRVALGASFEIEGAPMPEVRSRPVQSDRPGGQRQGGSRGPRGGAGPSGRRRRGSSAPGRSRG